MYKVLYRKWRPQVFDDVYGQRHITETLKNQIRLNRFGHAYLFTGSRGTGKTTCAKILAKAVNCLDPHDGNPCGKCENCLAAENGSLLDIVEMDAASNRGIDDIRALIEEAAFNPSKGKFRVYIIDEVHMVTTEAFNALLKTLEEPPEHVMFILATTDVDKLPSTILSRCQRFDFNRIPIEDISARLKFVAEQEKIDLDDDAAMLIASVADGALRDALSLLDRCIGISSKVDIKAVRSAAGLAQKDYIFNLSNACINKNCAAALEIINKLHGESKNMVKLCEELIQHFRSLMLIETVKNPRALVFMTDEEFEAACRQCDYLDINDIIYFMDVLARAQERMGRGNNNRTELESAMVKLCSPELDFSNEALLARIAALEKQVNRLSSGVVVKTTEVDKEPIQDEKAKAESTNSDDHSDDEPVPALKSEVTALKKELPSPAADTQTVTNQAKQPVRPAQKAPVDLDSIIQNAVPFPRWPEVIEVIGGYSKTIASALKGSSAYTSGNYLLIDTDNDIAYELLKNSAQKNSIRNAVYELTGVKYSMGPYKKRTNTSATEDPLNKLISQAKDNGIHVNEI